MTNQEDESEIAPAKLHGKSIARSGSDVWVRKAGLGHQAGSSAVWGADQPHWSVNRSPDLVILQTVTLAGGGNPAAPELNRES